MVNNQNDHNGQIRLQNSQIAYQVATNLMMYEGRIIWSKFNAMLVANSIVLASIGLSATQSSHIEMFSKGMPIVGIILCLLWLQLNARGFDNYTYWIFSAREIEEKYLSNHVQILSRGGKYAEGYRVYVEIDGKAKALQTSTLGNFLKAKWASNLIIIVFFAMYLIFLQMNI